ncbi:2389_t:CDS:10 [Ambispora gerdemannii]|uniref:2389_t:CDS:1 n=1 Tax=Ambispora gerdemannii TaxID=144530 RepID=A0A9N9GT92_9GLOM|nr:2389_t:CDS:10 [Ambispora gerdemannii]
MLSAKIKADATIRHVIAPFFCAPSRIRYITTRRLQLYDSNTKQLDTNSNIESHNSNFALLQVEYDFTVAFLSDPAFPSPVSQPVSPEGFRLPLVWLTKWLHIVAILDYPKKVSATWFVSIDSLSSLKFIQAYVEQLKEIISDKHFTVVKFYKKLNFPVARKKEAEEVLYESLKIIASENNVKARNLLGNFDKLITSNSVMTYWDGIYIQNEKNKTQFIKDALKEKDEQESYQIKLNVREEHIIESNLLLAEKRKNKGEELLTPPNKVRICDTGYNSDSSEESYSLSPSSEIAPRSLTNVFLELKDSSASGEVDDGTIFKSMNNGDDYILEPKDNHEQSNVEVQQKLISESVEGNHLEVKQHDSVPKPKVTSKPKYIQHDLAQDLLSSLRLCPLKGNKWLWNGLEICNSLQANKNARTPLNIGVVNFHNNLCIKPLPSSMITYIQEQMENEDVNTIFFDDGKKFGINKFSIDIDEEVMKYLDAFQDCTSLDALRKTLHENSVHNHPNLNSNISYIYSFFNHMYNLYSNETLSHALTEYEYDSYVWTPLLCNAFMEKGDIRISSGEVSSVAYDKLKKLAQLQTKSGPKMDSKATIISISQEVLIRENGRYDIASKRKSDLSKLEYCSKVLLASAYLALPIIARPDIHRFEIYAIQTNASYIFENTICMLGLTDIIIPRTVDAFPKCVEAVCKVLSWKYVDFIMEKDPIFVMLKLPLQRIWEVYCRINIRRRAFVYRPWDLAVPTKPLTTSTFTKLQRQL